MNNYVYLCVLLLLFGCNGQQNCDSCQAQLNDTLAENLRLIGENAALNATISGCEVALKDEIAANLELILALNNCSAAYQELNQTVYEANWTPNLTRYSFTCSEIPLNTPPYSELTRFRCYWDIRDRYAFGMYYDPMSVCVQHNIAGWIESCACVNQMHEIYGKQVVITYGAVGVNVIVR